MVFRKPNIGTLRFTRVPVSVWRYEVRPPLPPYNVHRVSISLRGPANNTFALYLLKQPKRYNCPADGGYDVVRVVVYNSTLRLWI